MKSLLLLCLALLSSQAACATHLLGGYISARPTAGSALTYEVTITLYMNEVQGKGAADQTQEIQLCFGDGTNGTTYRQSRVYLSDRNVSINTYRVTHTYNGPGTYTLATSLPNRTSAKNITSQAVQGPLTLATTFTTNTNTANQTPALSIPQIGFMIAANQRLTTSLRATDADGDSLTYNLTRPLTSLASDPCVRQPVASYQYPNDLTRRGTFKLSNGTGDLTWDAPVEQGYYSVALTVSEYRNGVLISQTTQEFPFIVEDLFATPGTLPAYEPAIESSIVTALPHYTDADVLLTTFPNPVDDRLQVVIQTSNPAAATVQLSDAAGRKLHELIFRRPARQHEQIISLDGMTPGVYVLRANINGRTLVRKVVKK